MSKPKLHNTTIAAIATPAGKSAIGIVRLSGPKTLEILNKVWQSSQKSNPEPYKMTLGWIVDGKAKLDQVMVVYMPAPNSYSGEDMAEIHCHGSQVVLNSVLQLLIKYGAKIAEAGEFTRRAFLNGKLDLVQAEAVADLIEGDSTQLAKLASFQLAGGLSSKIDTIKEELIGLAASTSANLDFSEEDIEDTTNAEQAKTVDNLLKQTKQLLDSAESLALIRNGYKVVLVGLPNAGKSTLLNALVGYDRAIVTDIAGTTRDTITETIAYKDLSFHFTDTAGLTNTSDVVEKIGVERSQAAIESADMVLVLVEPGNESATKDYLEHEGLIDKLNTNNCLIVFTKQDSNQKPGKFDIGKISSINISAKTQQGLTQLLEEIFAKASAGHNPNAVLLLTNRQVEVVGALSKQLIEIKKMLNQNLPSDILQAEYKRALETIGTLTGEHVTEEVITGIFSRFCIGK